MHARFALSFSYYVAKSIGASLALGIRLIATQTVIHSREISAINALAMHQPFCLCFAYFEFSIRFFSKFSRLVNRVLPRSRRASSGARDRNGNSIVNVLNFYSISRTYIYIQLLDYIISIMFINDPKLEIQTVRSGAFARSSMRLAFLSCCLSLSLSVVRSRFVAVSLAIFLLGYRN